MGAKSHLSPEGFASALNAYLKKVLEDNNKTDLSGRWLEQITSGARRYDYWSKFVKNTQAMTTNDIQVIATAFGVTPYEWVANTRRHAQGQPVPLILANVGAMPETGSELTAEQERALRQSDEDIAAFHGHNDVDVPHAD